MDSRHENGVHDEDHDGDHEEWMVDEDAYEECDEEGDRMITMIRMKRMVRIITTTKMEDILRTGTNQLHNKMNMKVFD